MSESSGVPPQSNAAPRPSLEAMDQGHLEGRFNEEVDPDLGEYQGGAVLGFEDAQARPEAKVPEPAPSYDMEPWDMLHDREVSIPENHVEQLETPLDFSEATEAWSEEKLQEDFIIANDLPRDIAEIAVQRHAEEIAEWERYQTPLERLEELQGDPVDKFDKAMEAKSEFGKVRGQCRDQSGGIDI